MITSYAIGFSQCVGNLPYSVCCLHCDVLSELNCGTSNDFKINKNTIELSLLDLAW